MPLEKIEKQLSSLLQSRKYRSLGIPPETIADIFEKELTRLANPKAALGSTREKLHHITALYLGDPDYQEVSSALVEAKGDENKIEEICEKVLSSHISTRERLPIRKDFYSQLFNLTGTPNIILDLACGLNPFSFAWMGLPRTTKYFAYDLHKPRIDLINQYFKTIGLEPLADHRDILVDVPEIEADIAFIFKEVHRMEQRQKGCSLPFWKKLNVKWLLVSLPTISMTGRHSLIEKHRKLVADILTPVNWHMHEIVFSNEIVFCINKG